MLTPSFHPNEEERLRTLQSLNLLQTLPEERFDRITHLARNLFNVPIALISLVYEDKQCFKSKVGLEASETAREVSFCAHAILQHDIFVIEDALKDDRFADNPLVTDDPQIRFYAGAPLIHPNGLPLGTLCLIDQQPRTLSQDEKHLLTDLKRCIELELVNQEQVSVDSETQLSDKQGFCLLGQYSLDFCRQHNLDASLAFLFVDGLLSLRTNETLYAHVLLLIKEHFLSLFRSSDLVGRCDPTSFVALLSNVPLHDTEAMLAKVIERINGALDDVETPLPVTLKASIVASAADDCVEDLIYRAFTKLNDQL
ncbi:GAF domain-containing protein [Alteromonas sediminis]|uniref:GAF domain-containing protein n=1 Tax=Alteromonas sediminis TaxID=2259342 RepID=UPI0014050C25|nr:GAF domain-containing protein [Alteromonas sediminis]